MELPFSTWYPTIDIRRSRRQFDPSRPIEPDILNNLRTFCQEFKPFPHARAELVSESPDKVFKGAIGTYGKIKNAQAFIAFIGDMSSPNAQEEVGYTGEGIILEATSLQLATCWVGGFFKSDVVKSLIKISKNEKILAVTPIGYAKKTLTTEEKIMMGFGWNKQRKPLSNLATGLRMVDWPEWMKVSLEAARLAPSAVNRQPWGFHVEPEMITVLVRTMGAEFTISKRLDCGIAMLHIDVAAQSCGIHGEWEFMEAPYVSRFIIKSTGKSNC